MSSNTARSTLDASTGARALVRRIVRAAVAVAMLVVVSVAAGPSPVTKASTSLYVAPWGNDGVSGSPDAPLRTVGAAVSRAVSGDTIFLRGGIYRESVQVFDKAVHIRSSAGERAVFDGARAVTGFARSGGDWYAGGWTTQFHLTTGGMVDPSNPVAAYPDQVFLDGRPLRQVLSRNAVVPGTFFHDTGADRIWIGDDPTGRLVEASERSWALYFNAAHGSRLTNVTVRRYATEGRHVAAIRLYGDNLVMSGVVSELNAFSGASAIGTNIVIRDTRLSDNGYIGLHAHQVTTFVVDRVSVFGNNKAGFDPFHSAAGIKMTTSTGITVRNSDVSLNDGPGIWTDIDTNFVTVACNLVEGNGRSGVEIELTSNSNVIGNATVGNGESGIWILESQSAQVWHNTAIDNGDHEISVTEGPRRNVQTVSIRNNILGRTGGSNSELLSVNDWTEERSYAQMNVTSDHNIFWRSGTVANMSRWGRWPQAQAFNGNLAEQRAATGQGFNSSESSSPPARDRSAHDYRAVPGTRNGAPLPSSLATVFGRTAGSRITIGPTIRTIPLGTSIPPTPLVAVTGGAGSTTGLHTAVRLSIANLSRSGC